MDNQCFNPRSPEELVYHLDERARRARARQLFHCYAPAQDLGDDDREDDDVYSAYYADEHGD